MVQAAQLWVSPKICLHFPLAGCSRIIETHVVKSSAASAEGTETSRITGASGG